MNDFWATSTSSRLPAVVDVHGVCPSDLLIVDNRCFRCEGRCASRMAGVPLSCLLYSLLLCPTCNSTYCLLPSLFHFSTLVYLYLSLPLFIWACRCLCFACTHYTGPLFSLSFILLFLLHGF